MRLAFLACFLLMLPAVSLAQGRAAAVGVQIVEPRTLTETVPVFAEVVTAREGSVASRVSGSVDAMNVMVGEEVSEGDVLVELNQDLLISRLAQARAQVAEARARWDTAKARIEEAAYEMSRSKIRAPFTGVVLETNTIPGAYIQAGTPVVRLLDTQSFEVQASVPSRYVSALQRGQEVQALLESGERLSLIIRAILPVEEPTTRTRAVRLSAPSFAGRGNIADGQSLTVDIPVGAAREVLSVPKDALVQARGGWTVFVATDGKAMPRPVTIGAPSGDRYEVLSGLTNGDVVVVRGNERLRPGQDIAPSPIEDAARADTN